MIVIFRCPKCFHRGELSNDGNIYCSCGYSGKEEDFYVEEYTK